LPVLKAAAIVWRLRSDSAMATHDPDNTLETLKTERQLRCPLCGDPGETQYSGLKDVLFGVPGHWGFRACKKAACGALWLDPRPAPDALHLAYKKYYTHGAAPEKPKGWSTRLHNYRNLFRELSWKTHLQSCYGYPLLSGKRQRWMPLLKRVNRLRPAFTDDWSLLVRGQRLRPGGRVLDVGCGNGDALAFMKDMGWQAAGLDFDPKAVAYAQARGLDVRQGDVFDKQLEEHSFDVVSLSHVIEHVANPVETLERCRMLLRPGGTLFVATPNVHGLVHTRHGSAARSLEPPRHLILFTSSALRQALGKAGFSDVRCDTSVRAFRQLELQSQQIFGQDPVDWSYQPDRLTELRIAVLGWLAAYDVKRGVRQGDELIAQARA